MANLVFAAGTPHGPMLPQRVAEAPGTLAAEHLMARVRGHLGEAAPDVILVFNSDHFTTFFYNNLPAFCVGAVEEAEGPNETYCVMPEYRFRGHVPLAKALLGYALHAGFDVAVAEELRPDHSLLVPLHFLVPGRNIPVVPLYINGLAPPIPLAQRCLALGGMVRKFLEQWDGPERVALLASGVYSLEVGGPRVGQTDEAWVAQVSGLLRQGRYAELAKHATAERMYQAGNVGGELLNWIALAGALGDCKPEWVETDGGSGFAVWNLENVSRSHPSTGSG